MKKLMFLILILGSSFVYSQVGIGNLDPKASLDINASNQATPPSSDGLLIPRINAFPITDPGADQDGMLVFLTLDDIFYYWENSSEEWIPLLSESTTIINGTDQHYVGELYQGGIIIYVYDNGLHGLIASLDDLDGGAGAAWGLDGIWVLNSASTWNDSANTAAIMATAGILATDAASLCDDYTITTAGGTYSNCYLPSILGIRAFEEGSYIIDKVLDSDGDATTNGIDLTEQYWSSTQTNTAQVKAYNFKNSHTDNKNKTDAKRVRVAGYY